MKGNLRDVVRDKLTASELRLLRTSFDTVGGIAVIEIPAGLEKKEKIIADALLGMNPQIKTVCKKMSGREGTYRTRLVEVVAGDKKTETLHREHGMLFKVDVAKAYFSPREATERQRVASRVAAGEFVLVMFAGVGPYAIAIAKRQPDATVAAVEINPAAVGYMRENVRLNGVGVRVMPLLGDVRRRCAEFYGGCDRVVMPLPRGAHKYLDVALRCLKTGGVVHFYHWAGEEDLYGEAERMLRATAGKIGRKVRITGRTQVLPYAPRTWKVCIDARVD